MSRIDLLLVNAAVVRSCVEAATAASPFAILIVVTNPLDEMTLPRVARVGLPAARACWAWRAASTRPGCGSSWPGWRASRRPRSRR